MKKIIIGLIIIGLTTISFAQEKVISLAEVEVLGVNYKYLNAIGTSQVAKPVKMLEQKVASFDIKSLDDYEDEEQDYYVYFKIPKGKILAVYDGEGEIIRTSERFDNISLPLAVSNAIIKRYPGFKITSDIYLVSYKRNGVMRKTYKLFIEKSGIHTRVKTDENGKFL